MSKDRSDQLGRILLRARGEGQEGAIGFGLQEISAGPGNSWEVREMEADHSFGRLCHKGKSWNER